MSALALPNVEMSGNAEKNQILAAAVIPFLRNSLRFLFIIIIEIYRLLLLAIIKNVKSNYEPLSYILNLLFSF